MEKGAYRDIRDSPIRPDTLRRLLGKVDEFSESHRAFGLPDDLLNILKDDLRESEAAFDLATGSISAYKSAA